MSPKSFTLLELLVVITVIAILAAIVLVSLSSARQRAWEARGMNFSQNIRTTLATDLVGEWSFDSDTISGIQARDTSGYNYYATLVGNPQQVNGQVRGALQFNGTNYAYSSFSAIETKLLQSKTLEVWFKCTQPTNQQIIAGYPYYSGAGTERGFSWQLLNNGTYIQLRMADGSRNQKYLNITGLSLNKWYHAVFVQDYEKNKIYGYLNGEKRAEEDVTGYYPSGGSFMIGKYISDSMYFYGIIDEVRVYNRPLTAQQIQQLYVQGKMKHLANK